MNSLSLIKELVSTYQAFESFSAKHVEELGDSLFKKVFPEHLRYLDRAFEKLNRKDLELALASLRCVKAIC